MDRGTGLEVHGTQQEALGLVLPTYESLQASQQPAGFSNPRYDVGGWDHVEGGEERGEEEEEGRGEGEEGDIDDRPPPYSPGVSGSVFVAPPDYFTIFGQIREAREESSDNFTFLRKLCQIVLNTVGCTVLLVVFMSVPVTILALGIHFIGDCPAEPNIPIFLVVGGVSGAVKNIALVFENIVKRMSHRISVESARRLRYVKFSWRVFNLGFNLFLIAWIIAGSYWIYHIYREVDPAYEDCHETLYKFAFGVITSSYILFTMMCCCVCFCGICLIQRRSGEQEEDRENEPTGEAGGENENGREIGSGRVTRSPTQSIESGSLVGNLPTQSQGGGTDRVRGSSQRGGGGDGEGNVDIEPHDSHMDTPEENTFNPRRLHSDEYPPSSNAEHHADGGRRHLQPALSLDDLEPLDDNNMLDYECTPVLSPRSRQLAANEQEVTLSPKTTSV